MMSRNTLLLVAGLLASGAPAVGATEAPVDALPQVPEAPSASELMDRAFENYFRYSYAARMDLTIQPAHGQPLRRVLDMAHWRDGDRSQWRIAFQEPAHLRGTQLLAIEQTQRDDEHFLLTPELQRVRRMSGAQKADRVAGTDFSFEDLDIRYAEQFDLVREEMGESEGHTCRWIRGKPHYASQYDFVRWCVATERLVILEMHGFDREGRRIKTLHVDPASVEQIGDRYLARRWSMNDERTGSRTRIELVEIHLSPAFEKAAFSARALERTHRLPFLSAYAPGASP